MECLCAHRGNSSEGTPFTRSLTCRGGTRSGGENNHSVPQCACEAAPAQVERCRCKVILGRHCLHLCCSALFRRCCTVWYILIWVLLRGYKPNSPAVEVVFLWAQLASRNCPPVVLGKQPLLYTQTGLDLPLLPSNCYFCSICLVEKKQSKI